METNHFGIFARKPLNPQLLSFQIPPRADWGNSQDWGKTTTYKLRLVKFPSCKDPHQVLRNAAGHAKEKSEHICRDGDCSSLKIVGAD